MSKLRASTITGFVQGLLSAAELREELSANIDSVSRQGSKKGSSISILLNEDSDVFELEPIHIAQFCDGYLRDELNEEEIVYCLTAIQLSSVFVTASDETDDAIASLSDPVANGPLTNAVVADVRRWLVSDIERQD